MARKEVLRAYKFALDPNPEQRDQLARSAGASRWAFNWGLSLKVTAHQAWRKKLTQLTDDGHTDSEARKLIRQETTQFNKQLKELDTRKKDLRKAARAEADPTTKARLQQQMEKAKADYEILQNEGILSGLSFPTSSTMCSQWRLIRDLPKEDGGSPWWGEVSSYCFSTAFANVDRAFKNFTGSRSGKRAGRTVGYPRFKKKGRARDSFSVFHDVKKPAIRPESTACNWPQYKGRRSNVAAGRYRGLVVPSLGTIRTHDSTKRLARAVRAGRATVQSVTISRSGNRWYASVLAKVQQDIPDKPTRRQRENGRVGLKWSPTVITLHYGDDLYETIRQPRYLRENADQLAAAQRRLSRTDKASARRSKARRRVAELHHHIAQQRAGWLHQLTARLTKNYEVVALEDLNITSMIKAEQPRTKSRRRNKAILDTAPGEMKRQVDYKTPWYGSTVALTGKDLATTQTCSNCGRRNPSPTPPGQVFRCDRCNMTMPRNRNAAKSIARYATVPPQGAAAQDNGEAQNARGAAVRPSSGTAGGRESGSPAGPGPTGSSP